MKDRAAEAGLGPSPTIPGAAAADRGRPSRGFRGSGPACHPTRPRQSPGAASQDTRALGASGSGRTSAPSTPRLHRPPPARPGRQLPLVRVPLLFCASGGLPAVLTRAHARNPPRLTGSAPRYCSCFSGFPQTRVPLWGPKHRVLGLALIGRPTPEGLR